MMLSPLVERELRVRARRPGFYWLRGGLALAAAFQGYQLLQLYTMAPPPALAGTTAGLAVAAAGSGATLLRQVAGMLFAAALLMALVSADSISRERREGTLGLLLLTDLSPAQVVRGKLISCGLLCFLTFLGCLPALMLAVLLGGVTGAEAAMTGLGLLATLFVALAAGLWMSARFRERRHALLATVGLVAALAFGAEFIGGSVFGPASMPVLRLLGLGGWRTAVRLPLPFNPLFLFWLVLMAAAGWLFLRRAAAVLATHWQDEPQQHLREPAPADDSAEPVPEAKAEAAEVALQGTASAARVSWLTDPRPWDDDPVWWRMQQIGTGEGLLWFAVALGFFGQFGALSSLFNYGGTSGTSSNLLSGFGLVLMLCSGAMLAMAGARFFQQTRRQQDLELLVTTPVGGRNILAGQWRELWQALAWPLILLLVIALPTGIAVVHDLATGHEKGVWFYLPPFLTTVNVAVELVALCWTGMWFGLRARSLVLAVLQTIGWVQLLPLVLALATMWGWTVMASRPPVGISSAGTPLVVCVLFAFLMKNAAFIWWARFRLRRDLRLGLQRAGKRL